MTTNYLNRKIGDDRFDGMKIFRVMFDHVGIPHECGLMYAVFDCNRLIGEYTSISEAEKAFLEGRPRQDIRLENYEGIDRRLR